MNAIEFCKKLDNELGEIWSNDYQELPERMEEYAKLYHEQQLKILNIPIVKVRYLLIEWVNGNPIIDGCKHFDNKDDCLEYWRKMPKVIGVDYTICETNAL